MAGLRAAIEAGSLASHIAEFERRHTTEPVEATKA